MKKTGAKLLVGCLAVVMAFSFNTQAQAAQSDPGQNVTATTAGISVKSWFQLEYAFREIAEGETAGNTIVLDSDIMVGDGAYKANVDYSVDVKGAQKGGDIVLDLNGHTISMGNGTYNANTATEYLFCVLPDTKLVIVNSNRKKGVDSCYIQGYTDKSYSTLIYVSASASLETLDSLKLRMDGTSTATEVSVIKGYTDGIAKEITILGTKLVMNGGKSGKCAVINVASSLSQLDPITIGGGAFVYAPDQSVIMSRDKAPKVKLYDCELYVQAAIRVFKYDADYRSPVLLKEIMADTNASTNKNKEADVATIMDQITVSGTSTNDSEQRINTTTGHFVVNGSKKVSFTAHSLNVISETASTCAEKGERTSKCKSCGLTFTEEIGKLDHVFTEEPRKEPTCTEEGHKAYCYCSNCKLYYYPDSKNGFGFDYSAFVLEKLPHSMEAVAAIEATCQKVGMKAHYLCKDCHSYYSSDSEGKNEVSVDSLIVPKKDHTLKTTTTKATLTADGKKETKCTACGTVTKTEKIYAAKTIKLSKTAYTYDGKAKKPTVTVKDSKGKAIATSNYSLKYDDGRKNVGKYDVKITFKGDYKGSKTLTFTINPKATTLKSVTPASKAFTATWSKQTTQVDGYEVEYALDKNFTSSAKKVAVTKNTTTSKKISSLKSKKTYYVRVRTYKKVGTEKYYSDWSKVLNVKTK